jgi:heat shock protein HtpX
MNFLKRFFLFAMVNVLVVVTISITLSILGVRPYLNQYGIDYQQLAMFCLVWGMGGSFISLMLSRIMAKMMMGVQLVDPQTRDPELQQLVQTVHNLARSAGLPKMPEVGIYDSPDLNAFATGPSKSRALVAVSSGLLNRMSQDELEGVLGHEISHIANGDMVTMTLIQGVINAFVMFMARVLAFAVSQAMRSRDEEERGSSGSYFVQSILVFVFEIFFSILGMIVVSWFSRVREYRADSGGARLAGREKMIAALRALKRAYESPVSDMVETPASIQAFQINGHKKGGIRELFSSHPPLDERIEKLELSTQF